jgi:hypothetical protein
VADTFLRLERFTVVGPDYARLPDAQLLDTADPDAFAVVYDRHVVQLFSWARMRVGDHAADLTAEVFARAWLRRRSFRDRANGSAFPWLYGIAQNVLRDSLRKRRVEDSARRGSRFPARSLRIPSTRRSRVGSLCPTLRCTRSPDYLTGSVTCSICGSCRSAPTAILPIVCAARPRPRDCGSHARYDD